MNILIALGFAGIVGALLYAGIAMVRRPEGGAKPPTMMRALALRVALSVALFACIWFAYWMGWIEPTGLRTH